MDDALWSTVSRERLSLADTLDTLTPEQWAAPSLCSEWSVQDVAAHLAMTPTAPTLGQIVVGILHSRGDLWAFGRDIAREYAQRPTDQIITELRRTADSRHLPPLTNPDNALLDIIVHGQDIARPLGIDRMIPTSAGLAAFAHAWSMGWPFHAQRRLRGIRLSATDAKLSASDANFAVGSGELIEGRLGDLLLLVTGRTEAALPHLSGPGISLLTPPSISRE
ncbi:maleylpyruvate isomerase family mycothiol-dependent enzyme [Brevibacterium sp. 'Marine']|uniref:maleylpyruvate isomerase family mycothiol-dependent enzyme n=1 Tax=Brevibacterium sp. 'Marine' TaxID=2725563 RepID=UPI00145CCCCA|nr:maleylpyruvate isomerase family mycothiol-dependent enzyme [Brevibacterium sp. 'Marine']